MITKVATVIFMVTSIVSSVYIGYNHGVNVGMTLIADRVGPALFLCVKLLERNKKNE